MDYAAQDATDEDDEENYEEADGGKRLFGFMFGNVDNSGDLDADYFDEAKEHLSALADRLGPSFGDIDLSGRLPQAGADVAEEDYDEKAEDAVDYEDIDEQYEGPEVQPATEEDYLLPKKDYLAADISLANLKTTSSVFDDEDYDEDVEEQANEIVDNAADVQTAVPTGEQGEHQTDSSDAEISEGGAEISQDELSDKASTALPVLCIEDGKEILRFSEIFGIHEPLRRREKRDHNKYPVPRAGYKSTDIYANVEDDEEEFLKGSGQVIKLKPEDYRNYEHGISIYDDDSDYERSSVSEGIESPVPRDSCFPAEPMKKASAVSVGRKFPLSPSLYPLDQLDWEIGIVWDNSPAIGDNSDSEVSYENGPQKTHETFLHGAPVIVEDFDSRSLSETFSERRYHPQLLRLESRSEVENPNKDNHDDVATDKVVAKKVQRTDYNKLVSQNKEILDGSWLDQIIWEQDSRPIRKSKLIYDFQDEQMLFEVLDNKEGKNLRLHAGAMVISRSANSNGDSLELTSHGGQSGWRIVSNDKHYSNRKTSQQMKSNSKKRISQGVKIFHSQPAVTLQTMKLKLSNKDLANFHRPKALWYPHDNELAVKEQRKLPTRGPMKIIIRSLGGKGSKLQVGAEETVSAVKAKASKKLDYKSLEPVKMFYLGKELEDDKSLAEQNVQSNSLLHLVRTKIHLLPKAQKIPGENKSLRPPGAFKKKSDLSVKDGHVFLMEYCEERPLLLSNIGMGARLCTYYQKSAPDDQTALSLRSANSNLGLIITLNTADKSPFLGDIKPGCSQSSLETNMYRAPLYPHKVPLTDYLLVRSPKGKISLRRIDRVNVVGQQEPLMEVMSPGTKSLQNYTMNRLLVHMCREFRVAEKFGFLPCIRADGLSSQFPYLSDMFLRKKLKELAFMQRGPNGQWVWVKKRNFRIYSEDELRNMMKPEEVCAYESMQAGLYRLKHLGITETHPSAVLSAISRLPDEAIALAAASHIERELLITPWNLSSNFVASTQGKENIERLEITGVGDPSGRGLGFSYVRVIPKAPISSAVVKKKSAAGRGGTTVTGTDADLRRLSMEAAREVLLKFNVPDEVIAKQTRWHRIAMIRKLSSEQAEAGVKVDPTTISKYARGQRMSFLQLQHQTREKCQEIWDRQAQSLVPFDGDENGSDSEQNNSDLDSFAGDLENLLDAEEECEEQEEEVVQDKAEGVVKGLKMRRRPSSAQAEEDFEDEVAEAAEICRLLIADDGTKKKKKAKGNMIRDAVLAPSSRPNFSFENVDRANIDQPNGSYVSKKITCGENKVDIIVQRMKPGKLKQKKKTEEIVLNLSNKKIKITGEVKPAFKEKKSARESFVCGACGQLGHMRTNKNCPRYGDPEAHAEPQDSEKAPGKSVSLNLPSSSQVKPVTKKLISKSATKIAVVEVSDAETPSPSTKILPVKFKCGSTEKIPDIFLPQGIPKGADQSIMSDSETGKSQIKFHKIIISNKSKPEDPKLESHKPPIIIRPPAEKDKSQIDQQKPTIVIRPPANTERDRFESLKFVKRNNEMERDQPQKKIIIKRPKEVIDLDGFSHDEGSPGIEHRKMKRMIELSSFETHRKQEMEFSEGSKKKAKENQKWWEEQEKQRSSEERIREKRMREEQERMSEISKYAVAIRREREEEEREKAKLKMKKKRSLEMRDEYMEEPYSRRFDKRIPERERPSKRRAVAEQARLSSDYALSTKRRRGGEVGLANILESIVEALKDQYNLSYLFLKPVSKKEAPDYLDYVDRPMDLSTIKEKVRKMDYKCREEFRQDVWQISENAHRYNDGRNPGIPPLADQLLELCDYILNENDESLTDAESGIESRDF